MYAGWLIDVGNVTIVSLRTRWSLLRWVLIYRVYQVRWKGLRVRPRWCEGYVDTMSYLN